MMLSKECGECFTEHEYCCDASRERAHYREVSYWNLVGDFELQRYGFGESLNLAKDLYKRKEELDREITELLRHNWVIES